MTRLSIAVSVLLVFAAMAAVADGQNNDSQTSKAGITSGELQPTPGMWFYEQYRQQYQDPKAMVRQNAEFRAVQRQRRLAAMQWFGFSNVRPQCSSDPVHGAWSPAWKSNNTVHPSHWNGTGPQWIVARPTYVQVQTR